jgi:hypothetical protein
MSQPEGNTPVRLKVSPEVARIVGPGAPREAQLAATRGAFALSGGDLLTVLCFLCASPDTEIKGEAVRAMRTLPLAVLQPVVDDPSLNPRLLDLLVRVRFADISLMTRLISHPAIAGETLLFLAERSPAKAMLEQLATLSERLNAPLIDAILANPQADPALKARLGRHAVPVPEIRQGEDLADEEEEAGEELFPEAVDGDPEEVEEVSDEKISTLLEEAVVKGLSKHQLAMEMKVSDRIKMAMTGDKEWRNILIKDPNKLVHGAVLKNGRITEAEVIAVARSKTSSDELVRLILLNRDWMKNSEIRKALALHPKTPLPKALRFVGELPLNDLKKLMKSRSVPNAIVSVARKEVENRVKRGGG